MSGNSILNSAKYSSNNTDEWYTTYETIEEIKYYTEQFYGKTILCSPSYMYSPRIYITEDGFWNLMLATVIPYDFYERAPLETMDYLIVSCPLCLNQFSVPIFLLALDKITVEHAIEMINFVRTLRLTQSTFYHTRG